MPQKQTLSKIDALRETAFAETKNEAGPKSFWDKYRLEFNYNSNHIEGNTLTYGHTQLLLLFDKVVADYSLRELEEMKAHDVALKMVKDTAFENTHILTEKFIKEINEIILVRPFYKEAITPNGEPTKRLIEPGSYKKYSNSVRLENGEIFNYALPEETSALMGDLIEWYRSEEKKKELHPIYLAALFHYRFVRIHPFDDSNGRTSRLLMNYILLKCGYAPIVIESADKKNYLASLNKADTGDLEAFADYIINISEKWQTIYLKAVKGEVIEEPDDFRKDIELLKRKLKNTDDRIEFTLSNEVLKKTFSASILPLLTTIIKELSIFDDMFIIKNPWIECSGVGFWQNIDSNSLPNILSQFYENPINSSSILIRFFYEHKQFRKSESFSFSYRTKLLITFDYYSFSMKDDKKDSENYFSKYYHEILTKDEIDRLAAFLAKNELNEIKQMTKI